MQMTEIKPRNNKVGTRNLKTIQAQKFMKKMITNQWNHKTWKRQRVLLQRKDCWWMKINMCVTSEQSDCYQDKD